MDEYYLRLVCYHCGSIMEAWDHSAGKKSRCARCDAPLKIPHFSYFKEFSGHKIMAIEIEDWRTPAWNAADHASEKTELKSPVLYAKESADGMMLTENAAAPDEAVDSKAKYVLPKESKFLNQPDESNEAIIKSIYDREEEIEEDLDFTNRDD